MEFWFLYITYGWYGQSTDSEYCKDWGGCTPERSVCRTTAIEFVEHGLGKLVVPGSVGVRGSTGANTTAIGPAGTLLMKNIFKWAGGL